MVALQCQVFCVQNKCLLLQAMSHVGPQFLTCLLRMPDFQCKCSQTILQSLYLPCCCGGESKFFQLMSPSSSAVVSIFLPLIVYLHWEAGRSEGSNELERKQAIGNCFHLLLNADDSEMQYWACSCEKGNYNVSWIFLKERSSLSGDEQSCGTDNLIKSFWKWIVLT